MRSEFEFIRNIKDKYGLKRVGDDCAVLPKNARTDLVITADLLVEDVDFRMEWTRPELLGHKALAVSLSDIAAMGGTPKWAMLSIGIPKRLWRGKFVDKFYHGWFALAERFRIELVGGDVSSSPDKVVIDSIVAGEVARGSAIMRSGAQRGDSIFVTGSLGGAAAGLKLLESGTRYSKLRRRKNDLLLRQLSPTPRVKIGKYLAAKKLATSMIDISDGLGADLHHLCDASGVGARIELDLIPIDENISDFSVDEIMKFALASGEDFELLFTSNSKNFSRTDSTPITRIGEITSNSGIVELASREKTIRLPRSGYRHF
ncbi:MAG: thiamine-phosphate kinase [Acidobacteria bacterium]|nr:MAG: thiamine-phosphate kinase [Acidobacteriota bacterium]